MSSPIPITILIVGENGIMKTHFRTSIGEANIGNLMSQDEPNPENQTTFADLSFNTYLTEIKDTWEINNKKIRLTIWELSKESRLPPHVDAIFICFNPTTSYALQNIAKHLEILKTNYKCPKYAIAIKNDSDCISQERIKEIKHFFKKMHCRVFFTTVSDSILIKKLFTQALQKILLKKEKVLIRVFHFFIFLLALDTLVKKSKPKKKISELSYEEIQTMLLAQNTQTGQKLLAILEEIKSLNGKVRGGCWSGSRIKIKNDDQCVQWRLPKGAAEMLQAFLLLEEGKEQELYQSCVKTAVIAQSRKAGFWCINLRRLETTDFYNDVALPHTSIHTTPLITRQR